MNLLKKIIKAPILVIFALVCVFMLPAAINRSSIAFRSAIALALGIDTNEQGEVVLYTAISVPATNESLTENSKIMVSSGATLGDAFANLRLMYGRSVRLGHTRFVMIGSNISLNNVTSMLDSLIRTNRIRNVVQLIYCPSDIGDMFNIGVKINSATGIKLSDIISHQQNASTTYVNSNIDSFYKGYFSKSKISKINAVYLTPDATQGISSNVNESESSDSQAGKSSGSEQITKQENSSEKGGVEQIGQGQGDTQPESSKPSVQDLHISNRGRLAIFENGALKTVLSEEVSRGVNWLSFDYNPKEILVDVDNVQRLGKAKMGFDILNKRVNIESFFHKNVPFISAKIILSLDLDEIIADEKNIEISHEIIDDNVKGDIGREIRKQISSAVKVSKDLRLDIFELNNIFNQNNHNEYTNYIQQGNSIYDLVEDAQLVAEVEIKII